MPHGKVTFQISWLQQSDSLRQCTGSWSKKESDQTADCLICQKVFNISNSGISQVKQHAKTDKYKSMAKCRLGENIATISFQQRSIQQTCEGAATSSHTTKLAVVPAILEQITTAELLWMLKVAKNDFSIASCEGISYLFKKMIPGPVTEGFTLSRSKASYFISDGLWPILTKKPSERKQQY